MSHDHWHDYKIDTENFRGLESFTLMFEKTSNTVATRKAGTFLYVHGYSELKNSWELHLPKRIEIINKSGINTTRYSYPN